MCPNEFSETCQMTPVLLRPPLYTTCMPLRHVHTMHVQYKEIISL